MEITIKGKEVIAYKGMESNMTCRDFQYEIGKTYKTDKAKLCECGFHACLNPLDVLDYYSKGTNSHYFKVKLSGEITKCDKSNTKVATTEITILEEITDIFDEVIETTEWWKTENVLDLLYWSEGFARIRKDYCLYNFIDKNGKLLSDEWFDWISSFYEDFARVERSDGLYNFIDKEGRFLFNKWFNYLDDFHDGFAKVRRGDYLWNFIDKNGNYLSDEWFNWTEDFHEGFAKVQRGNKLYNFIDKQGNIISKKWFKWLDTFHEGFARVRRTNGRWYKIDKTGKLHSN